MPKAKDASPEVEISTQELPCVLTDLEKLTLLRELGEAQQQLVQIDEDVAAVKAEFKARREQAAARVALLSHMAATGRETRTVEIEIYKDFAAGRLRVVRIDTGEVLTERPLSLAERQMRLPGTTGDAQ